MFDDRQKWKNNKGIVPSLTLLLASNFNSNKEELLPRATSKTVLVIQAETEGVNFLLNGALSGKGYKMFAGSPFQL